MYSFTDKCIEQAVESLIWSEYYAMPNQDKKITNSDDNQITVNPVLRRSTDRNIFDGIIENLFGS